MDRVLVHNIGMLATPRGFNARRGEEQGRIEILRNAWILCEEGRIVSLGSGEPPVTEARRIDAEGLLVTPKDIDRQVALCGKLLGYALNLALQRDMTAAEMEACLA